MEPLRIFYSWQSDRDRNVCGRFIELALEAAIERLSNRLDVEAVLDSATKGVAGTPPVSETILRKISECDIFIGDVSFVAETAHGKRIPNPNVMVEFGYARSLIEDERIMLVMNEAFGSAKELPFDLAHLRHPTRYTLCEAAPDGERRQSRDAFSEKIEPHLEASIRVALKRRQSQLDDGNVLDPAFNLLAGADQRSGRGDVPALVPGPKLVIRLAPLTAAREPYLDPQKVKAAMRHFIPAGYEQASDRVSGDQWARHDPPTRRDTQANPESRWYVRLMRPGVLEGSFMVGARIDDDRTILVEGHPLEGRIVDALRRFSAIATEIGLDGPGAIAASLHGLEDVQLCSKSRASRPLQLPGISLGTATVPAISKATPEALRRLFDSLWLGCGFVDGSPSFVDGSWDGDASPRDYAPAVIDGRSWR